MVQINLSLAKLEHFFHKNELMTLFYRWAPPYTLGKIPRQWLLTSLSLGIVSLLLGTIFRWCHRLAFYWLWFLLFDASFATRFCFGCFGHCFCVF